jgi:hypothetical protein
MPAVLIRYPVTVPVPAVGGLRVRCDSAICDPGWRAVERIEMEYRVLGPVEVLADGRPVAIGAHYRHTTPEMAARAVEAIQQRLTVVLGVAELAVERHPNRSTLRVF